MFPLPPLSQAFHHVWPTEAEEPPLLLLSFLDPITQELLVDPVTTADGHTYSRAAITLWFTQHDTSPITGARLANKTLTPNYALRAAIEEWLTQRPMAIKPSLLEILTGDGAFLGEGGFGRVVGGLLTTRTGRPPLAVAVKQLPALTREEERRAFDRELRAHMHAARHCDGVCVLYGTCVKEQRMCIVMKRYERSLADAIASGPMDSARARRYGHSLFRTLRQLHECGLIVQDIKPANILIDRHDEVVISDFGISEVARTQSRIMPSSVRGTFNYMSPEAFDPHEAGGIGAPAASGPWAV